MNSDPDCDRDYFNPAIIGLAPCGEHHHAALADDITPCISCDERYDGPRLCDECRARYARIEAREYPDRTAEDAAWLDMVDEVLTRLSRSVRRPS